jgi:cAMP-dependent protein kinase regulator
VADKRGIVRSVPVFSALSDHDCDVLLSVVKARRGAPGDVLFREGDRATSMLVVLDGGLSVRVGESEVARLGPGEVVGEMALFDVEAAGLRTATVAARASTTVLELGRDAVAVLRKGAPLVVAALHRAILGDVTRRLRAVNDRVERVLDGGARPSLPRASLSPATVRAKGPQLSPDRLRTLPALREYGDEDLTLLARATALHTFAPREHLFDEGSYGQACFLLLEGTVEVVRAHAGKERTLGVLSAGALVGQLAMIDRSPHSATVVADGPVHALELGRDVFERLLAACTPLALRFQEHVAVAGIRQLRAATARLAALLHQRDEADAYLYGAQAGDDWDSAIDGGPVLELAVDPVALRSRR